MEPSTRPAAVLADPARRDAYVTAIFDLIAPRYDRFTRWFSYGMDAAWKRELRTLVAETLFAPAVPADPVIVDLACGTGDLTMVARCLAPRGVCIGVDVSQPMLRRARARAADEAPPPAPGDGGLHFAAGDMARLPIAAESTHLVTAGYALRNAPHLDAALDEIARVLRPGGRLITLDFYIPASRLWRSLFLGYLAMAGWLYGLLWHRRPEAYVYIPRSIRRFVTAADFARALQARGLRVLQARRKLLGAVMVHVAEKAA